VGSLSAWWLALRPKTLLIALASVAVGTAAASLSTGLNWGFAALCLAGALLLQVASNFANDLFDFRKGADTEERIGPTRAVASGLLTERQMMAGLVLVELGALAVGIYLSLLTSWVILAIGLAGMTAAVLYTAGPFPLGYHGLGDLFVFLFFGLAAVAGSCFVQTGEWNPVALWLGVPMGSLGAAVLTVNNIRDLDTDSAAGKRTLPVRLGRPLARVYYAVLLGLPYVLVGWMVGSGELPVLGFLCFLTLPVAVHLGVVIYRRTDGPSLNAALAKTAALLLAFGLLLSAGLMWG
jgi:1,4-dihydroxy-2-naphthoate octaprenyltransferase